MAVLSSGLVSSAPANRLPRLEAGDHLDRATFHARYLAMPESTRAELLGGVVYMPSPLQFPHGEIHGLVMHWLWLYAAATPGVRVVDNATVLLADDSEPQPDACLLLDPAFGGQTRVEGGYLSGPPELVVEVASSSEAYDLFEKMREYERAGVREYLVILLREQRLVWMRRSGERFEEFSAHADGLLRSEAFPGLWLDPAALLRLDSAALREALEQGLATPQHEGFVRER